MTRIKKTTKKLRVGDKTTIKEIEYYELNTFEVENMLQKVRQGGDETKLRKELIKNSIW